MKTRMETRSSGVRPMFGLVLLLVWVSPPSCRASWMWLGATSGGPERLSCGDAALSGRQRAVCRAAPLLLRGVRDGARLAVAECQNRFRLERWNCSTTRNPAAPFGHEMTSGTKETAFIYAVMAAGLVHSVTRACSQGNMTECGCDARLHGARLHGARLHGGGGDAAAAQGWQWGGCSDNIGFGTWFSRRFMDVSEKNSSTGRDGFTLSTMNRHNAEAGRQAIQETMSTDCRCHGISGSCAVKTCWRSVAPFQRVGAYLKERYERSIQVSDRARRKTRKKDQRHPVDINELIYLNKSPNYCLEDRRRGIAGTRGRRCNRTSAGPDGCNLLCCGRGYNTHVVRNIQRCECKFVWCCYVHCRRCESMSDMHTCK